MIGRRLLVGVGVLLLVPGGAMAAEANLNLPLWTAAPFALLLLAIALLPLAAPHVWHRNSAKALVALLLALPIAAYLVQNGLAGEMWLPHPALADRAAELPAEVQEALRREGTKLLLHEIGQYLSFIILLGSLYTVTGGVVLRGSLRGGPLTNAGFLLLGAALANVIGTTGASMLLVRPLLRINAWRQHARHIPVFFIFLVSNLGGLLTPLGDPPLFLGFLRGVDFFWTLALWPQWLVANGTVLAIFLAWETFAYLREKDRPTVTEAEPLRLDGLINLVFLAGILAAVLLQADQVAGPLQAWLGQFFACPALKLVSPWGEGMMLLMALLSLLVTNRRARQANSFTWGPIVEVAVLFAGIFVTMAPVLMILKARGREWEVTEAWQYFWLTGGLSSVLDNAPTYVGMATLAASPHDLAWLAAARPQLLAAVSCGAVFMGANTYIGNGPNFMVKAIAEEAGYRMPSFFGYMLFSGLVLLPTFGLVTYLFFW